MPTKAFYSGIQTFQNGHMLQYSLIYIFDTQYNHNRITNRRFLVSLIFHGTRLLFKTCNINKKHPVKKKTY